MEHAEVSWPERTKQWVIKRKRWLIAAVLAGLVLFFGPLIYANATTTSLRYTVDSVPTRKIAITFGAGVLPNGDPTPYLKRRLDTAAKLFHAGKAEVLLLSGDNSTSHHNEPVAMKRYVESLGVPASQIVLDYAGFNTYDSCYRARAIFEVREAILVTHDYHLPRALMTCRGLGVQSIGVAAENTGRAGRDFSVNYMIREFVSTDKAFFQLVLKPKPTALGQPEPIDARLPESLSAY